ncbi:MAG: hypothetical protein KAS63_06075 [Candidatus Heimdallarchaeota archaeon]|nr:hypothetical protein [Candidatus Heimdallarchaeota archaeon]MCK4954908.1 hypothetical protein [Candidatus Heimdallarchaeota archaeon]
MVEAWQNKIPLSAIIFESVCVICLIIITFFLWKKYLERQKRPVLFLGLNFSFFTMAVFVDIIGRWIGYFSYPNISYLDVSYTDLTTLLNYILLAIANCFVIIFIDEVFLHKGTKFVLPFGVLNGLVIGLIIPPVIGWFSDSEFGLLREQIGVIIVFAVISVVTYGILAFFAIKEGVLNTERLPKIGFHLIGTFGVCLVLLFLSFAGDTFIIQIIARYDQGYSPFFYLGFALSILGIVLGFLGYIMPSWFKNIFSKTQ